MATEHLKWVVETEKSSGRTLLCKGGYNLQKRKTDKAYNYRPISLLCSIYKVYMILIRARIQAEIETEVTKTQYGFRPANSTAHAIL